MVGRAGDGVEAFGHAFSVVTEIGGLGCLEAELAGFVEGVDVGAEEDEGPAVVAAAADDFADFFAGSTPAGVLVAVGDDRHELELVRIGGDSCVDPIDNSTNRVEEGGGASGSVRVGIEVGGTGDGSGVENDLLGILPVELHEGDSALAGQLTLLVEERVEPTDGVVGDRPHPAAR